MRSYLTLALTVLGHAALSLGLLSVAAAGAMARIDTGVDPSLGERVLGAATTVLWLPLAWPVAERIDLADGWIVLLVLLNSLVWAAALLFVVRAVRRRRRA